MKTTKVNVFEMVAGAAMIQVNANMNKSKFITVDAIVDRLKAFRRAAVDYATNGANEHNVFSTVNGVITADIDMFLATCNDGDIPDMRFMNVVNRLCN